MNSTAELETRFHSTSELETARLGADVALVLLPGDILALSGELGAGKSVLARGIIRHLLQNDSEVVASPTYTLCNHYSTEPAIAHFDLYRLTDPEELEELALDEALEAGCAIIEWPERGFETLPSEAVHVQIEDDGEDGRSIRFSGNTDLVTRIHRMLEIRSLLKSNGYGNAERHNLDGDASSRRYERILVEDQTRFLMMDSPEMPDGPPVRNGLPYSKIAHLAENVTAFAAIDQLLLSKGFCAPNIPAMDLESGLLLIEYFGDGKIVDRNRLPIKDRYMTSVDFLAEMHACEFAKSVKLSNGRTYKIPEYDRDAFLIEVDLLIEWYAPEFALNGLSEQDKADFKEIWEELIIGLSDQQQTLVLRDFHSPNIIWREDQTAIDRIGVIDFQDAVIGPCAYDVASLAQDARVDVSAELEDALVKQYVSKRLTAAGDFNIDGFKSEYAVMAAQRATKILGIFCRLNKRDRKPQYLAHLPRIRTYLDRSLNHPVLAQYKKWLGSVIEL